MPLANRVPFYNNLDSIDLDTYLGVNTSPDDLSGFSRGKPDQALVEEYLEKLKRTGQTAASLTPGVGDAMMVGDGLDAIEQGKYARGFAETGLGGLSLAAIAAAIAGGGLPLAAAGAFGLGAKALLKKGSGVKGIKAGEAEADLLQGMLPANARNTASIGVRDKATWPLNDIDDVIGAGDTQMRIMEELRQSRPDLTELEIFDKAAKETAKEHKNYYLGLDKRPRKYISDKDAAFTEKAIDQITETAKGTFTPSPHKTSSFMKLGDMMDHKELFDYNPGLADTRVRLRPVDDFGGVRGVFDPRKQRITLNIKGADPAKGVPPEVDGSLAQLFSTLLHETGHVQQSRGNLAMGASPSQSFWDDLLDPKTYTGAQFSREKAEALKKIKPRVAYMNAAGEIESRAIQKQWEDIFHLRRQLESGDWSPRQQMYLESRLRRATEGPSLFDPKTTFKDAEPIIFFE